MKSQLLSHDRDRQRTFAVVFEEGEEAVNGLQTFAANHELSASSFTAIGAFERVTLGYFDISKRDYARIALNEQVEVMALTGNVALAGDERRIHAHVVVGKADGSAWGGHLLEGCVRPTLEVIVVESPAHLRRTVDSATGLALLDLETSTDP